MNERMNEKMNEKMKKSEKMNERMNEMLPNIITLPVIAQYWCVFVVLKIFLAFHILTYLDE
jgi:hypothetical protein